MLEVVEDLEPSIKDIFDDFIRSSNSSTSILDDSDILDIKDLGDAANQERKHRIEGASSRHRRRSYEKPQGQSSESKARQARSSQQ